MYFKIVGRLSDIETFASGRGIREHGRLRRRYGGTQWRKRKGMALVELPSGDIHRAELHWYEATGVGRREFKIKRFIG